MQVRPQWMTAEFIARQGARLKALQTQLLGLEGSLVREVQTFNDEQAEEAQEYEDRAQDAARDEIRQGVHDVDEIRVHRVERALQKIAEGTYGFSDISGEPIPRERLEVVPEAVSNVDEQVAP
jgi:DnaK suppressor protein